LPPVIGLEAIILHQGAGKLFDGLSLYIGARDRFALVGRNGAGKTTLLKLVAGMIEPDGGKRSLQARARVVLLEQEPQVERFATLRAFAMAPDGDGHAPQAHLVEAVASDLGLDLDKAGSTASGGEKRRAALCRALGLEPDILLLDEPTNHLDLAAIEWLEERLAKFQGAFLIISHDRMFLSRLTRTTLWLDKGTLRRAEVGFGGFEAWQEQVFAEEERQASRMDARLKLEEHWLQRGVTARRRRNQGRLRKLEELRAERKQLTGPLGVAKVDMADPKQSSRVLIDAQAITKVYGERTILKPLDLRILRGDRLGIVGANGAGKSTLLKLLIGTIEPDSGTIRRSATIELATIDQERSAIQAGRTVRDVLADGGDWVEVRGHKTHAAGYLKQFLFDPKLLDAKVETLSGGEQSRLLIARQLALRSNLIVLDEPTNDLDLETIDLLEETLSDYDGTVIVISHDRDFLDRVVTSVAGMDGNGTVDLVVGGYTDWLAKRKVSPARSAAPAKSVEAPARPSGPMVKLSYKDQRDLDTLPDLIAIAERQAAKLEAALSDAGLFARDPAQFNRLSGELDQMRSRITQMEERWLDVATQAEALKSA
jgi:ABC transport system ATP-binding/permease protein